MTASKPAIIQIVAIVAPIMITIIGAAMYLGMFMSETTEKQIALKQEMVAQDRLLTQMITLTKEQTDLKILNLHEVCSDTKERIKHIESEIQDIKRKILYNYTYNDDKQ